MDLDKKMKERLWLVSGEATSLGKIAADLAGTLTWGVEGETASARYLRKVRARLVARAALLAMMYLGMALAQAKTARAVLRRAELGERKKYDWARDTLGLIEVDYQNRAVSLECIRLELDAVLDAVDEPRPIAAHQLERGDVFEWGGEWVVAGEVEPCPRLPGHDLLVQMRDVHGRDGLAHIPRHRPVLVMGHKVYAPWRDDGPREEVVLEVVEVGAEPAEAMPVGGDLEAGGVVVEDDGPVEDFDYYKWGA